MKKNEEFQKEVHFSIINEPLVNAAKTGVNAKFSRHLRKFIYITSLAGMGLFLNSCMAGYVATEPVYVEYSRPPRASNMQIWIDGDWGWNSRTHVYVQKAGYWENPRQGRTYVAGHWQSTPHGKSWSKGHYQRQGRQVDNHKR